MEENNDLQFTVPKTKVVEETVEEELSFNVPETKVENSFNENLFRAHIINVSFEDIYTDNFKYLSVEEVKESLIANKENYSKEVYFNKLLAIVEEKLEKTMR